MPNPKTRSRNSPAILGLLAVVVLVALIGFVLSRPAGAGLLPIGQGSVTTGATGVGPAAAAPTLEEQLTRAAVATILELKSRGSTEVAMTQAAITPATWTPGPTAISDNEQTKGQWLAFGFLVENAWSGPINGGNMSVFAGAYSGASDQGTLEIIWTARYLNPSRELRYDTPGKHGSIHIVRADNNRLTLVSTDGTTFYFDVPGLQFVSSLTDVVPTITPPAAGTPGLLLTQAAPTTYPIASESLTLP
jgi:hypothetical protein